MLEQLTASAEAYIHSSPLLAVGAVFLGGALTATNPCVLAMIPLTVSYVAAKQDQQLGPARALLYSLALVAGLAVTFTILGMVAALAGTIYGDVSNVWIWIVAAVCLVMGLHLMGVLKFSIPVPASLRPRTRGVTGAFLMGLLFGVISAPCAAPILVVLLTYLAGSGASVAYGALLLLVYALGHSVLILLAGTSMGMARRLIESGRVTRATAIMRRAAGGVIVLMGVYFIYTGLT